jgi:hypothetical protein
LREIEGNRGRSREIKGDRGGLRGREGDERLRRSKGKITDEAKGGRPKKNARDLPNSEIIENTRVLSKLLAT